MNVELDTIDGDLNWERTWKTVHNGIINYKVQSSLWEMIHRNYIWGIF